jgi:hypothetical protein
MSKVTTGINRAESSTGTTSNNGSGLRSGASFEWEAREAALSAGLLLVGRLAWLLKIRGR